MIDSHFCIVPASDDEVGIILDVSHSARIERADGFEFDPFLQETLVRQLDTEDDNVAFECHLQDAPEKGRSIVFLRFVDIDLVEPVDLEIDIAAGNSMQLVCLLEAGLNDFDHLHLTLAETNHFSLPLECGRGKSQPVASLSNTLVTSLGDQCVTW